VKAVEFGSLFQFIRNGMNVKQDKSGDGLPITRIETISDATVDESRVGFAGLAEVDCRDWLLKPGDILFSHINSVEHIGKCAVYRGEPEKLVHGMNLLCLRSDADQLFPEFAKYLIRGKEFRKRLANFINKAVNQASVSIGNLKTIPVTVPALHDQRRIAAILDKADALLSTRGTCLTQLDTLTQSIFLDMFGDPAANSKGFPIVRMGVVCDVRDGTHDSPKYVSEGGYPLVTSKNVTGGDVDLTDVNYISEADYLQINKRSKVDRGDIILPMIGTIGSPVLVDHEPSYAIKNVALIKFTTTSPSAVFVHHLLSGSYFDFIVGQKNRGGTQKFVSLGDLRAFPIPLPSNDEQQVFAHRVEAVNKIRTTSRKAESNLNALFASLEDRAFRGEL